MDDRSPWGDDGWVPYEWDQEEFDDYCKNFLSIWNWCSEQIKKDNDEKKESLPATYEIQDPDGNLVFGAERKGVSDGFDEGLERYAFQLWMNLVRYSSEE